MKAAVAVLAAAAALGLAWTQNAEAQSLSPTVTQKPPEKLVLTEEDLKRQRTEPASKSGHSTPKK